MTEHCYYILAFDEIYVTNEKPSGDKEDQVLQVSLDGKFLFSLDVVYLGELWDTKLNIKKL